MNCTPEFLLSSIRQASNEDVFSEAFAVQLLDIGRVVKFPPKAQIQKRETRVTSILIPLSAPIYAFEDEQSQKPSHIYEVGQLIGLAQALTFTKSTHHIRTRTESEILSIPSNHMRSLIDMDINIRWQLIGFLALFFQSNTYINRVIQVDPALRLAELFVILGQNYGQLSDGSIWIDYKLSQDEIGERIGTSRQTVNKYVQEFIDNGWLARRGHKYGIVDMEALKQFSKPL